MNQNSLLYENMNYLSTYPFVINNYIREYDLSAANINALYTNGYFDKSTYNLFKSYDKKKREVEIGLLIKRDSRVYEIISSGIINAKKLLFESNNIQDNEVLTIKNDAVFIISKELVNTVFGNYEFKCKNLYNTYLRILDLEIYYRDSLNSDDIFFDIKGISDDKLYLHTAMVSLISEVCYRVQRYDKSDNIRFIMNIYENFLHRRLPIEYYRNLDSFSKYTIINNIGIYSLDNISNDMINIISIDRNLSILRELIWIISSM